MKSFRPVDQGAEYTSTIVRQKYREASRPTGRKVERRNRAWQAARVYFYAGRGCATPFSVPDINIFRPIQAKHRRGGAARSPPYFRHICVLFPANAPRAVSLARTVGRDFSRGTREREKTFSRKRLLGRLWTEEGDVCPCNTRGLSVSLLIHPSKQIPFAENLRSRRGTVGIARNRRSLFILKKFWVRCPHKRTKAET